MTALLTRWLPCATLSLWSLVLLYYAEAQGVFLKWVGTWTHLFSGRVDAFLIPTFRPLVLIAGLVMLVMAVLFVIGRSDAACCQAADCAHPLSRFTAGKWLSFLILVVPVAVTARTSPDGFSLNTINNRGVVTDSASLPVRAPSSVSITTPLSLPLPVSDQSLAAAATAGAATSPAAAPAPAPATTPSTPSTPATEKDYLVRTPEGYIAAEVLDLIYAAQDPMLRKDFEGKKIQLIGQLMPDVSNQAKGSRFKAVRMFMQCCAADARPVATFVEAKKQPDLPEMTWIKIIGTATFPIENGRRMAVIQAETVDKTEPPTETMLY